MNTNKYVVYLISDFRRVLNVVILSFGAILRCLNFMFRSFGTRCLFFKSHTSYKHLHTHPPPKIKCLVVFARFPKGKYIKFKSNFECLFGSLHEYMHYCVL